MAASHVHLCDVSSVGVPGLRRIAAEIFWPHDGEAQQRVAVVCAPGGGMSRRYFDLRVPPEDERRLGSFSMARYFAAHGHAVIILDPPGIGDSDGADDLYELTPAVVSQALAIASSESVGLLRWRTGGHAVAPVVVGLGHSAGAMLTVLQQDAWRPYGALVLLGFHGFGLPEVLADAEARFTDDAPGLRAALPALAAARFGSPTVQLETSISPMLVRSRPPRSVMDALGAASAPLLSLVATATLVPGFVAGELARLDVPIFLANGENDITSPARDAGVQFRRAADLTLFTLAGSGHNHNAAANRMVLWDRILRWIDALDAAQQTTNGANG
ncbi:alpha/beta hydrolase [Humibacter sp.]|uniref:alpha/beta hydrolase n=1 Tax=Humibacter sp. TaxID=1940291 RepID=UPI002B69D7B5|nr:alpha/beta hydrolase [Humibacter sp.]HVX09177.1 alpha/beta hydrolase [Humibacter sp.]